MGATVRKSDFIDAMEENQKDVRKMVMDSYHDIEKGKGRRTVITDIAHAKDGYCEKTGTIIK